MTRRGILAKTRRRHGFTLVETLVSTVILSFVMGTLVWVMADAARLSTRVSATATLQSQTRRGLDLFAADARASNQVLSSYGAYTSSTTGALILEAPSYDSSGGVLAGKHDDIVYHLVGTNAPYTLNRYVASATGSARPAQADTVIARNVQSATFVCQVGQTLTGADGATTRFALNAPSAGSGATLVKTILKNGASVPVTSGAPAAGQAQYLAASATPSFPQGSVLFGTAPGAVDACDLRYSVDPSSAASAAQVTGVTLDLKVSVTDAGFGPSGTEATELVSAANLRNH